VFLLEARSSRLAASHATEDEVKKISVHMDDEEENDF
jgi:hypothetical protein